MNDAKGTPVWVKWATIILVFSAAVLLIPRTRRVSDYGVSQLIQNNLRLVVSGLHTWRDVHREWPGNAIRDQSGKPLLSWRVAILPYIEEETLYKRFKLDEPWDSPHNSPLLEEMPAIFANPMEAGECRRTETHYQVLVGPGTAFEPSEKPLSLKDDFPDDIGGTILVVWADRPVPWTKPEDVTFHPEEAFPVTGEGWKRAGFSERRIVVGMGNAGAVRLDADFDPVKLRHGAVRNDGVGLEP